MKKTVLILVLFILILTGCEDRKETINDDNNTKENITTISKEESNHQEVIDETEDKPIEKEPEKQPSTPVKEETPTKPSTGDNTSTKPVTPTKPTTSENPVEKPTTRPTEPTKPKEEPKEEPKPEEPTTCNRTSSRPDRIAYLEIPCGEDASKYMAEAKSKMNSLLDGTWDEDYACYAHYGDEDCHGSLSSPGYIYSTDNKKIGIYIEFTMYHDIDNDGVSDETVGKGYITPDGKIKYSWKNY